MSRKPPLLPLSSPLKTEIPINSEARTGRPIMADQTFRTDRAGASSSSPGLEKSGETTQSAKEQALSAWRAFRDKDREMAGSSTETVKNQATRVCVSDKEPPAHAC